MLDDYIQRELFRDTVDPERTLSIAVDMENGHQNQQRISSNNNNVNSSAINEKHQLSRFHGENTFNRAATGLCRGCGQNWTSIHCQVYPALSKIVIIVVRSISLHRYVEKNE